MPTADTRIPARQELDPAACWSIEDLFPSDAAWEEALAAVQDLPAQAAKYRGRLGESPATLLEYLEFSENLDVQLDSLFVYAMLRVDEDTTDPAHQAMQGRLHSFSVKLNSVLAFDAPELTSLPQETLDRFYQEEPRLEKYRRYLTRARQGRDHILSQPEEDVLTAAMGRVAGGPSDIYKAFCDADLKFPPALDSQGTPHPVTNGTYHSLLTSPDRTLRRNAFQSMYHTYGSFRNGIAAMYNAEVQKNVFRATVRKYHSTLESALAPSEIPEEVYHNLIAAVHANMDPMYRYMELRKKVLSLDELHLYDVYVPLLPDADLQVPFSQAKNYVLQSTLVYGSEYHTILSSAFDQRWMDIYENQGKRVGAYSCGCRVHPYVLLNYHDDLDSAFALAHEMGHAMHSWLSTQNQPPIYANYTLFVAEVASTCNEALLMQYLLNQTQDKRQRAYLINHFLEQFRTTLYRQVMFAEFEEKAHALVEQGESLTAQKLCQIHKDLVSLYFGPDVFLDEEIAMEWARIPHFYRRFYVYQYATGFSAAIALSRRILSGDPQAVQDYLGFLSGGCSADPISLLKGAGVDLSTPAPVSDALAYFGELVEELTALLEFLYA